MKKLFLFLLLPSFLCAEPLSVDLICEGELTLFCEDGTPCLKEPAIEKIKISGSTLIHKLHGNHFLNVDESSVSLEELDTDGSIKKEKPIEPSVSNSSKLTEFLSTYKK